MPRSRRAAGLAPDKLRLIQVAKRQLGMEDADYRVLLARAAGVTSSRELTEAGFRQVMDAFARLGFTSTSAATNFGRREGFASAGQVATIRRLWGEFTAGEGTDATLGQWLEKFWHVSALRFLRAEQAPKVIIALRQMTRRRSAQAAA